MTLLMHMCCGPCSTYPIQYFQENFLDFEGIYFNPNIHPLRENLKRYESLEKLSKNKHFKLNTIFSYHKVPWIDYYDNSKRCFYCYSYRLGVVGEFAKLNKFNAISSSLLISPYQNHDLIADICTHIAKKFDLKFYYHDFRPQFREGQITAKNLNLYRQKYCGCYPSISESKKTKP